MNKISFFSFLRPYFPKLCFIAFALLIEMAVTSAIPYSFKFIIDNGLMQNNFRIVIIVISSLAIGGVVTAITGFLKDYFYAKTLASVLAKIRQTLFDHLQKLSMAFFKSEKTGHLLGHFFNDMSVIETAGISAIPWAILPFLDVCANAALLFFIYWPLALFALLSVPLVILGPKQFVKRVHLETVKRKEEEANILSITQENLQTQPLVKIFRLISSEVKRFANANSQLLKRQVSISFFSALIARTGGVGVMFFQIIILGTGAFLVFKKQMTIGSLVAFQTLFLSFCYSVNYVIQSIPIMAQGNAGWHRIKKILSQKSDVTVAKDPLILKEFTSDISFNDVSFGYKEGLLNLKNITFTIPKGTSAAFVGSSGSGKSTIFNLATRFYDPTQGKITIDGYDLKFLSLDSYYSLLSVVFQETFLYNTTIYNNILLGKPEATENEIIEACKAAEIYSIIEKMPQGLQTNMGERGEKLSGGQKQRVAIARALLKKPQILLLDEATSALDPMTAKSIDATFNHIMQGKTSLIISHRLDAVSSVDQIFLLEEGKIVEKGTHQELIDLNDKYKRLWEKQQGFTVSDESYATITLERLKMIPLFSYCDDSILEEIIDLFTTEIYPPERTVIHEGDFGSSFFIIVRGIVVVSKKNQVITTLEDGDFFGEVALLKPVTRTASVRTTTHSVFLTLQRSEFNHLIMKIPHLKNILEQTLVERKIDIL